MPPSARARGFSAVELVAVLAVVGLIAWMTTPKFQTFMTSARQSEAKNNLVVIHALETSYRQTNGVYAELEPTGGGALQGGAKCDGKNALGFKLHACEKSRYRYTAKPKAAASEGFVATARSAPGVIVPDCKVADEWRIDELKRITAARKGDALKLCNQR